MEGVGVAAAATGAAYIRRSAFLPSVLCPLLEKLGAPARAVSETAATVLHAIAVEGGFAAAAASDAEEARSGVGGGGDIGGDGGNCGGGGGGSPVARLVADNADYVVDMLSRHLRHLDDHPRAAQFLAVGPATNCSNIRRVPCSSNSRNKGWQVSRSTF